MMQETQGLSPRVTGRGIAGSVPLFPVYAWGAAM